MVGVTARLMLRGVKDLGLNPWAQILTLAAVTLVAFLSGMFLIFLHNLNLELLRTRGEVLFQVYWRPDTDQALVEGQWKEMRHMPFLQDLIAFTPEQGLETLSTSLGGEMDLTWLKGENPLPFTALLSFSPKGPDQEAWTQNTLEYLKTLSGVEKVHFNPLRTDLAHAWAKFSNRVLWPLIAFLGLVLALVVGNTIKLSLMNRRTEIDILRLVGAKNWYIQLPLLVGGAVQGLVGGVLAVGMLKVAQLSLHDILNFPPLFLQVQFLPLEQAAVLVAVLTAVGIVSSWVAVRS